MTFSLAIELAARRVEAYGLHQTAALLDQRLTLPWVGPRTAPPRQKTLHATLDWSYGLLSETEGQVLRRLAIFVGHFTLDAVLAVVTSATLDQGGVFGAIDTLINETIQRVETNGDVLYVPELLRVKGGLLLLMPRPGVEDAEECFMQSLEWSRRQGARMGVAHRGRSGNSACRSGTTRERPGASAAGV
jgi:hypothetical protein